MTGPAMMLAHRADLIVVGSGAAGLTAAETARDLGLRVLVITKGAAGDSNTKWAQGGIAAVMSDGADADGYDDEPTAGGDTVMAHVRDTLVAGAGLCDPEATQSILADGQDAVRTLIHRGLPLDRNGSFAFARGREGGHAVRRILHAGGDRTGKRVSETLLDAVTTKRHGKGTVELLERHIVIDLLRTSRGTVAGVSILNAAREFGQAHAPAVLLATGGVGQLYAKTTNPSIATADGLALALRAGAWLADIEHIQIHPTALFADADARGQAPLITEALRGAGAVLVDAAGNRVMDGIHEMGDLAPRDVVAAQITRRLACAPGGVDDHVFLDARCITPDATASAAESPGCMPWAKWHGPVFTAQIAWRATLCSKPSWWGLARAGRFSAIFARPGRSWRPERCHRCTRSR
jgi:L-aspartate oxidase